MRKRNVWKMTVSLILLSAAFSAGSAAEKAVGSKWTATPPVIDGQDQDWADAVFTVYKDAEVEYAVSNDAKYLYILFKFNNPKYISNIDTSGMTIWFDAQGKKNKDFGIRFQKQTITADQLIATIEKSGRELTDEQKKEYKSKPKYVSYESLIIDKSGNAVKPELSASKGEPAVFRQGQNGRSMVYEFRVPLAGKDVTPFGIGVQAGSNLKIDFEWGGLSKEQREKILAGAGEMRADSGRVGNTGGGEEGNFYEANSAGLESKRRQLTRFKKYDFWTDIKLAVGE